MFIWVYYFCISLYLYLILCTSVFYIQGGTTETVNHTTIGTLCSHIIVQAVQEGHTCPQHYNRWVLPMDRFFHCSHMDTGATKQMEDIRQQQSCFYSRRNNSRNMETCAISVQSCWLHLKRNWTYDIVNIHTLVEGTTMAFPGTIQLAYNRGQHSYRQPRNQTCASCMSTNSRRHHPNIF